MKSILIIDNDKFVIEQIRKAFSVESYKVHEASNGWEGLEIAIDKIPDLIITNRDLPQLTGIQLSREIRNYGKINKTPVLLTSIFIENGKYFLHITLESKVFSLESLLNSDFIDYVKTKI